LLDEQCSTWLQRSRLLKTLTKIWTGFCVFIKRSIHTTFCIVSLTTRVCYSTTTIVIQLYHFVQQFLASTYFEEEFFLAFLFSPHPTEAVSRS